MSNVINIRRDVSDKFYRYKMPKLQAKVEGKGNGIKTVIPNMSEIARALSRPPMYPTKFFGCELGAQVQHDAANDRHIVNGAHDSEKLQGLLDVFIDKFVLCPSCKNPETDLQISKDKIIFRDCKACGAHLTVDMHHRLSSYILNNPPPKKAKTKNTPPKLGNTGEPIPTPPETNSNNSGEDDNDDELTRQIEQDAALIRKAPEDEDDDDWAVDTSAEAAEKRMKELSVTGAVSKLLEREDDEEEEDPLSVFLTENPNASDSEITAKVKELGMKDHRVCAALAHKLFNQSVLSENQIPKRAKLLCQFSKSEKAQKGVIGGIERLAGISHPELIPKVAIIFKALYDADVVEEETFLSWGEKASKKYVDKKINKELRNKAEPFLSWLREAEEEDDDDEDEDEDDE
eukprot:jgi/Hompol1/3089/HPOL_003119-RA